MRLHLNKWLSFSCVWLFFITTQSMAFINHHHLISLHAARVKNLQAVTIPDRVALQNAITDLANGKTDAYSLSLPLLASAELGDRASYDSLLEKMNAALLNVKEDTLNAWLLGRVIFAADSIGDTATVDRLQQSLVMLLQKISTLPLLHTDSNYAMYAWSCGYYAALSEYHYEKIYDQMIGTTIKLIRANLRTTLTASTMHELRANTVWALVMDIRAAANASDKPTYAKMLYQLKALTEKATVSEALQTSLARADNDNDYPAWAFSVVALAAATLEDTVLYEELKAPLQTAIQDALAFGNKPEQTPENQWKAKAEATLAELNVHLAEAEHQAQAYHTPLHK